MAQDIQRPAIPNYLGERSASRYNNKFIAGALIILAFVGFLGFQIVQATRTTGAYYMTVGEVQAEAARVAGQRVRVNGNVVEGTENWDAEAVTLKFSIQDESGHMLPIVFYGPRPDNFQRAASAIVEGELKPDGSFQADQLLLKCPSRYDEVPDQEIVVKAQR